MRRTLAFAVVMAVAIATAATAVAAAEQITVLSTPTLRRPLETLAAEFARQTSHELVLHFDGVPVLARRIEQGEPFDIAFLLPDTIDELVRRGMVSAGTRADIARTVAGVAIRAGATRPDVSTIDGLRNALLGAARISYSSDSASGTYFLGLLRRLGVEQQIQARLVPVVGRSPVEAVARGEADLTVITVPNIVGVAGVELGGLLPEELQNHTTFSAGISLHTEHATAANDLISFLRTGPAAVVIRSSGLEPIAP